MKLSALFSLILIFSACSSLEEKDSNSAEGAYEAAQALEKEELYEQAIRKYSEVKNKHPYSKYAVDSELKIADIHFERESYSEARAAYQIFKDLHPTHKKIAYVTHRLAMSYYHQLPDTIDRDLGLSSRAIVFFDEVVRNYPSTKFAKEAAEKKVEVRKRLAEKELYIADFYFKRDQYLSAFKRYEAMMEAFADVRDLVPTALLGAGKSAVLNGDRTAAKDYLNKLIRNHSNSSEADAAREVVSQYGL